jgi:hypothetical protein
MNSRAKRIYGLGGAKTVFPMGVLMWGLMGVVLSGFGLYVTVVKGTPEWFLLVFGAMCLLLAVVSYRRAKALQLNC